MGLYLPEFSSQELSAMTAEAYQNFDTPAVVPLHPLTSTQSVMELFLGPTRLSRIWPCKCSPG